MWPALTRLPSQLQELSSLLREQNQLIRELIFAVTHAPANTRPAPRSIPRPPRIRTDADVHRFSAAEYLAAMQTDLEKIEAPWRDPAPSPPSTNPNPLIPEILDPVASPAATDPSGPAPRRAP